MADYQFHGALLGCNCEPKEFDKARQFQLDRIAKLKKHIADAEARIKEINNIDKSVFEDMKSYDKFIEAEEKRKQLEKKILAVVEEQIVSLRGIWYGISQNQNNVVCYFEEMPYRVHELETLCVELRKSAVRDHSSVKIVNLVKQLMDNRTPAC